MSAGYSVGLAEGERRAREVLAHQRVALTILARGQSGELALKPDQNCGKWIVVTDSPQDIGRAERSASSDEAPSIPLNEQAVLTGVKSILQTQPNVPDGDPTESEIWSFDGFTIDLPGHSVHHQRGSEVPLTRSEFALSLRWLAIPAEYNRVINCSMRRSAAGQSFMIAASTS